MWQWQLEMIDMITEKIRKNADKELQNHDLRLGKKTTVRVQLCRCREAPGRAAAASCSGCASWRCRPAARPPLSPSRSPSTTGTDRAGCPASREHKSSHDGPRPALCDTTKNKQTNTNKQTRTPHLSKTQAIILCGCVCIS